MTEIPDLNDPRYLDEIGWFLYHEKYGRARFGGSYDAEFADLVICRKLSIICPTRRLRKNCGGS